MKAVADGPPPQQADDQQPSCSATDGGEHRQATDLMCAKDCGEYRKIA
jgi:hypothetical protein